jgi:hypothetical protein
MTVVLQILAILIATVIVAIVAAATMIVLAIKPNMRSRIQPVITNNTIVLIDLEQ